MKYTYLILIGIALSCITPDVDPVGTTQQSNYISQETKNFVFARDKGQCRCCKTTSNIQFDHIKPFSCGGSNESYNIQLLCQQCNASKSNGITCHIHNRTVGHSGCEGKPTTSASNAASKQCTGTTKAGKRCKNMTKNPIGRCHLHD